MDQRFQFLTIFLTGSIRQPGEQSLPSLFKNLLNNSLMLINNKILHKILQILYMIVYISILIYLFFVERNKNMVLHLNLRSVGKQTTYTVYEYMTLYIMQKMFQCPPLVAERHYIFASGGKTRGHALHFCYIGVHIITILA